MVFHDLGDSAPAPADVHVLQRRESAVGHFLGRFNQSLPAAEQLPPHSDGGRRTALHQTLIKRY